MSVEQDPEIQALRENIEETRQRIANEVEAIGERLSPEHAKEVAKEAIVEAKDKVVETVKHTAQNVVGHVGHTARSVRDVAVHLPGTLTDTIRANPIPTAMVAVGAGWLLWQAIRSAQSNSRYMSSRSDYGGPSNYDGTELGGSTGFEGTAQQPDYGSYGGSGYAGYGGYESGGSFEGNSEHPSRIRHARERVRDVAQTARERVSTAAGTARERLGTAAQTVRDRSGQIVTRGREVSERAWHASEDAYVSNPIAFGAVAVLAGVGVGMLVPSTAPENRLLGERRQQVLDRAREVARGAKDVAMTSAREGVREGLRAAKDTARSEAEEHNLPNLSR